MEKTISDNKRIAKNTLLLYGRMLFVMAVSLYTSRVVLSTLGITDYGIYNVVGSIVVIFDFLKRALGNATHRYIAFYLGKNDLVKLKNIFSTCVILHVFIALLLVILAETIGLWFLYNKLVIPEERMEAAFWVFQFSVVATALAVICVPYDAEIIAHEKMNIYAYFTIIEVLLKLGSVFLLTIIVYDKLVLYGFFILCIGLINRLMYGFYCGRHFPEAHFTWTKDKSLMKEMGTFAGWNLFGHAASAVYEQGFNIMLNMFYGPAANAARGVALQVQGAINGFVSNFQMAVNPQITKSYANNDISRVHNLIFASSRFSYYLYLLIGLPALLEIDLLLDLWLVDVPAHADHFIRLILVGVATSAFFMPLNTACLATGNNRLFLSVRGLTNLSILPLAYVVHLFDNHPESMFVVQTIVFVVSMFIQLTIVKPLINLSIRDYFSEVLLKVMLVSVFALPLPIIVKVIMPDNLISFLTVCVSSTLCVCLSIYVFGITRSERSIFNNKVLSILLRSHKKW